MVKCGTTSAWTRHIHGQDGRLAGWDHNRPWRATRDHFLLWPWAGSWAALWRQALVGNCGFPGQRNGAARPRPSKVSRRFAARTSLPRGAERGRWRCAAAAEHPATEEQRWKC